MAALVKMTGAELALAITALEYFRRNGLGEFAPVNRADLSRQVAALADKLRRA